VDRRGPMRRSDATAEGISFGDDFEPVDLGGHAVELPADQPGNDLALLHAGAFEDPMIGPGDDPVAATVDRTDVAGAHQQAFVGTAMRERPEVFVTFDGVPIVGSVGTAAKDDAVRSPVVTLAEGADPADTVARQEQEVHPFVA